MYDYLIFIYAGLVRLAQYFNPKARLMIDGHRQIFRILEQNIDSTSRYIWFHAASLGEFEQGRPVIEKIKAEYPQYKILLTFFSPSGYEVRKNYPFADIVCYLPFDRRKNVLRFLKIVKPSISVFIKYEFWYNYLTELHRQQIPTYIVSAIFRPTQLFFRWYGGRARKVLRYYAKICVQNESSKKMLENVGVTNVVVCGDTRFDRVFDISKQAADLPLIERFVKNKVSGEKQLTLVAGSSWPNDEDVLIPYFNKNTALKLIVAPHEIHESHLGAIESRLQRPAIRYSQLEGLNPEDYDCVIIDCFGLLSSIYRYGEIAYVGGGFGVGIHNVLEAAVYNIPVVFGPNYQKFREANHLIEFGGGYSFDSGESFAKLMDEFFYQPQILANAGNLAGDYVLRNTNAVEKVMSVLKNNL
jgi:3-deoxy-D-manno-octulosonic-acid transferase